MFVRRKRGRAARRSRARSRKPRAGRPRLPEGLQQRHLDLIGLFLIALGVFLTFVLFFGWDGGKVGFGLETGLEYLFGEVGARIACVLMLVIGGLLVTGTSISTLFRGIGKGLRRVFLGGRGVAETVIKSREAKRDEKTYAFETQAGPTDVMSAYPEEDDEFDPTVALAEDSPEEEQDDFGEDPEPITQDFQPGPQEVEVQGEEGLGVGTDAVSKQAALTPMGSKRGVTTSEEIAYRPPPANTGRMLCGSFQFSLHLGSPLRCKPAYLQAPSTTSSRARCRSPVFPGWLMPSWLLAKSGRLAREGS
jgi:hypothetical protein